jgi:hypothetical protein
MTSIFQFNEGEVDSWYRPVATGDGNGYDSVMSPVNTNYGDSWCR